MIEGVNANLSSLIGAPSVMVPRPKVRSNQEKNTQARKAERGGGVAGLNPTTVAAALEAGVAMAHLEEMGKILQSKPPRLEDVPRKPALKKKAGFLEESAEEEEESDGAELIPDDAGGADQKGSIPPQSIEQALLQLTTIATKLTKADQKKDKLDLILEGGSGSAGKRAEWSSRHEEKCGCCPSSSEDASRRPKIPVRAHRNEPASRLQWKSTSPRRAVDTGDNSPRVADVPFTNPELPEPRSLVLGPRRNMGCIDFPKAGGGPCQMRAVDGSCRPDLDRWETGSCQQFPSWSQFPHTKPSARTVPQLQASPSILPSTM